MHPNPHTRSLIVILAAGVLLTATSAVAAEGPAAEKEQQLLAVLRSDAPAAEKAITCKHLSVYGSSDAVPDLARLLSDEQLASWARIALEVIPGPAADEALRRAQGALNGKLLVGTIHSIGVRRDAGAVELLARRLTDQDAEVASAAAVALGQIGNADATKSLRAALAASPAKVRSAVAEGCVLCAERCMAEGREAEAAAIYDEVRNADLPKPRILEATRGLILARKSEGVSLLVEQLRSPDEAFFRLALGIARELSGDQVDKALAEELTRAKPERASRIVMAMADRPQTVVLPAILRAAGNGPKPLRLAAIGALGRVGDASCLSPLVEIAQESDADLVQAAKLALADLPGEGVNQEIVKRLAAAQGTTYPLLIELVGSRRIAAVEDLLKGVEHPDPAVRHAALTALGNTIPAKSLAVLISQVTAPQRAEDAPVALQALQVACVRMPDREACAAELAAAFDRSPVAARTPLLQMLGAVGGTKALQTLAAAAKSGDPALQDTSTRLLGEWMTADAAPVLLDLARTAPGERFQVRALRGYVRIARQFVMPEPQRAEMCDQAFESARSVTERKLVLDVVKRYPSLAMLPITFKAAQVPELKEDASQAALLIVQKSGGKGIDAPALLAKVGLSKVKVEILKAEYGAGATQKDVTETLQRQVTDWPLITLRSPTYNASFGGDPAPGSAKQLRVRYRLNGKAAEASFAENDLIIFPMPK